MRPLSQRADVEHQWTERDFAPPCDVSPGLAPRISMEASQRDVSGDIPQTVIEYKVLYRAVAAILEGAEIIGGLNTIVLIVDTQSLHEVPHFKTM